MNPSRTIGSIRPHITRTSRGSFYIFESIRGKLDLANRSASWHGKAKSESENPKGNIIFKTAGRKNNSEVEKVGRKNSIILNHVDMNNIKTDLNHVNLNHANLNKLIPTNPTTINDSADFHALNKILSCYGDLKDTKAHASPTRTNNHVLPVKFVHKPSPVPDSQTCFTNGTASDPQSPYHDSSEEIVTPKGNPTPRNKPPNLVPNVPDDPDSDTSPSASFCWIHLTHHMTIIINEDDVHK